MQDSVFGLIKKGFLIGIGLMIPLAVVQFGMMKYSMFEMEKQVELFQQQFEDGESYVEFEFEDEEEFEGIQSYVEHVKLVKYDYVLQDDQLLVRGQVRNNSDKELNSIDIEAELFDVNGQFIYECSTYLHQSIKPSETENFLIWCACGENGIKQFETMKVAVINAMTY